MRIDQFIMSQEAIDRLADDLLLVGRDGSILDANAAALECYGHSHTEMLALSLRDIRVPHDQDDIGDQTGGASESGAMFEAEDLRGDGTRFPVEVWSAPIIVDGEDAVLEVVHDITERKREEQALQESESRYRALAEGSPLGIFVNRGDKVVLANPACVKLFGASTPEDLVGMTALELFHPDSQALVRERIHGGSETVRHIEGRIVRLDGMPVDVEVTASPLPEEGSRAIQVVLRDITERKQGEEALRAALLYSRSLIEASLDPLATIGPDGKISDVNCATEEVTGFTRDELIGSDFSNYFTEPDKAQEGYAQVYSEGQVVNYPLAIRHVSGKVTDVLYNATLYRDEAGQIVGVLATARDVTEVKKAQAQVARLAAIVKSSQDAIFAKDLDDIVTSWNAAAETLFGYSAQEMIGTDTAVMMLPGHEDEPRRLTERVRRGERISGFESLRRRKDGSQVEVSLTLSPVLNEVGDIVAVSVIGQDITERKQAEEALRREEELYRATFEHAAAGIAHVGTDGAWLRTNQRLCDILGYTREELSHITFADITHPDDLSDCMQHLRKLMKGDEDTYLAEKRYLRKDGSVVWVNLSVALIRNEDGAPDYQVTVVEDITDRKQMEEELLHTLTSVTDAIGTVSEMRDPYTAGHQRRVAELATKIARDMGMPDDDIADLGVAALLHDIGKMSVPAEILTKPGALSPTEFRLVQEHAEAGYRIIASAHMRDPIGELVYQHHERCDGSGYPRGLAADDLLMGSKVLMVADVVEAMVSHRPYRPALGMDAALAEIEQGAGRLYDSDVAESCLRVIREHGFVFSELPTNGGGDLTRGGSSTVAPAIVQRTI